MSLMTQLKSRVFILPGALVCLSACSPEHGVEFATVTPELEGMVIDNSYLELEVGQTIAVRGTGTKNGERKEKWSVALESVSNPTFSAQETYAPLVDNKETYAVIAHEEGEGSFTVILDKKHDIQVSVVVKPRAE
ncbi:MAG: hypothetical protein MK135_05085 [Polyangiaceae bacterium]|nr:hypothetical protein [Polyangiaceae bacterium]